MPTSAPTNAAQQLTFQGIVVPGSSLNPQDVLRRHPAPDVLHKTLGAWPGFGKTDDVDTLRSGILRALP